MQRFVAKFTLISLCAFSLTACGFVTAPVTQGLGYAGKGTIIGVDTGMAYGKVAVKKSKDTAIYVRDEAIDGFKPVPVNSTNRGSLRPR